MAEWQQTVAQSLQWRQSETPEGKTFPHRSGSCHGNRVAAWNSLKGQKYPAASFTIEAMIDPF
jgi:hypothetical protein